MDDIRPPLATPPRVRLGDMGTQALSPVTIRPKQFRQERQRSQAELAGQSGVPQFTISRIEADDIDSISLANLGRPAGALAVNAALLIVHDPGKRGR